MKRHGYRNLREEVVKKEKAMTPKYVKPPRAAPVVEPEQRPVKERYSEPVDLGVKYVLTDNTRVLHGVTLYQIRAVRDFGTVRAGDLGGWVSDDGRLSHAGRCWIAQQAAVYENGCIRNAAWAMDTSLVRGDALLAGTAYIADKVVLEGKCRITDEVHLYGEIKIGGSLFLKGRHEFYTKEDVTNFLKEEIETRRAKNGNRKQGSTTDA